MDAQAFWDVIGAYNAATLPWQVALLLLLALALALSYTGRVRWAAKLGLGLANLFIGIVFFGVYGTEPIQKFFALPLYLACGALLIAEAIRRPGDAPERPDGIQASLLALSALYPLISAMLGNRFPGMVTHIMPCPVVSLTIAVYSGYRRKNIALLALLTIWGLTGVKSLLFRAYEDIILLLCGLYGIFLLSREAKRRRRGQATNRETP